MKGFVLTVVMLLAADIVGAVAWLASPPDTRTVRTPSAAAFNVVANVVLLLWAIYLLAREAGR